MGNFIDKPKSMAMEKTIFLISWAFHTKLFVSSIPVIIFFYKDGNNILKFGYSLNFFHGLCDVDPCHIICPCAKRYLGTLIFWPWASTFLSNSNFLISQEIFHAGSCQVIKRNNSYLHKHPTSVEQIINNNNQKVEKFAPFFQRLANCFITE